MKKLLLLLLMAGSAWATSWSEFYCRSGGDNLNAGSTTNVAAINTYAGGTFVRATGVFTVGSGNPSSDGVTNGAWASIYTTAGATVATCVGLVTNVTTSTITISQVAMGGAVANVSETAAAATCKVGGAWKGPNSTISHPFNFAWQQMTNTPGVYPRVNFLADATYLVTGQLSNSVTGPIRWQGYTNTPGDMGKATIDNATVGAGVIIISSTAANNDFVDFILSNSGATSGSSGTGISLGGPECLILRCVAHDFRAYGFALNAASGVAQECEAYLCNKNSQAIGAFYGAATASGTFIRCIAHDNSANNSCGFVLGAGLYSMIDCISDSNQSNGVQVVSTGGAFLTGCDFYNNGSSGLSMWTPSAAPVVVQNCNFIKNGAWGIDSPGSTLRNGWIQNCAFGAGTMVNASGAINSNVGGMNESGTITYANDVSPWVDPANGNFTLTSTSPSRSVGLGRFTQTQSSYGQTTNYVDIGAVSATSTNVTAGGGGTVGYGFAQ